MKFLRLLSCKPLVAIKQIMRLLITFILAISSFNTIAQKNIITLYIVDGYTNVPLKNCELIINKTPYKTDSLGQVFYFTKAQKLEFKALTNDGYFYPSYNAYKKKWHNEKLTIYMYPSEKYEQKILNNEDSLYGWVNYENHSNVNFNDNDSLKGAIFPGGVEAMQKFIAQNRSYPQISIEMGEQGPVYLDFIVEPNGKITHVRIIKAPSLDLGLEAKRLVRAMPAWQPGEIEYEKARVLCKLPIIFILN